MSRVAPSLVLLSVTALLLGVGPYPWSWLGGPVAALLVWGLDRQVHAPTVQAPAPPRIEGGPAAVD